MARYARSRYIDESLYFNDDESHLSRAQGEADFYDPGDRAPDIDEVFDPERDRAEFITRIVRERERATAVPFSDAEREAA